MSRIFSGYPYGVVVMALCLMMMAGHAAADDPAVAVVVSRKIRPYVQVTDGILEQVSQKGVAADVFFLSPGDDTVRPR